MFGYLMAPRKSVAQVFPSSQTFASSMCQITWSCWELGPAPGTDRDRRSWQQQGFSLQNPQVSTCDFLPPCSPWHLSSLTPVFHRSIAAEEAVKLYRWHPPSSAKGHEQAQRGAVAAQWRVGCYSARFQMSITHTITSLIAVNLVS